MSDRKSNRDSFNKRYLRGESGGRNNYYYDNGKYVTYRDAEEYKKKISNADVTLAASNFAFVKGRLFEYWIDDTNGTARSNGYSQNELIENPAYVIESLLRDEVFTERDLQIDDLDIGNATITIDGSVTAKPLLSNVNDYYNYAIVHNVSTNESFVVTDYDGGTYTLTLDGDISSWDNNDNVFITNIQGGNKIDVASFDVVGNTTNGKRNGWKFARSFGDASDSNTIINEICMDSFCLLTTTQGKYKLIAMDAETGSVDTWDKPLIQSVPLVGWHLSSLDNVYTDYKINYRYNYAKGGFDKNIGVNALALTGGTSYTSSYEQELCANSERNYKLKRTLEISSNWIADKDTADRLLSKIVRWFHYQHLIVNWSGDQKNYLKYEVGDQVLLDFPSVIPASKNDSALFMIVAKEIEVTNNFPKVNFQLIEMV